MGVLVAKNEMYEDNRYALIRITRNGIAVYDKDGDYKCAYFNFTIRRIHFVDDQYLYFVMQKPVSTIRHSTVLNISEDNSTEFGSIERRPGAGMLDIFQLVMKHTLEYYMFTETKCAASLASTLTLGHSVNRLCFAYDFSTISLTPFFHRNTFNFTGMGKKTDYLVWR